MLPLLAAYMAAGAAGSLAKGHGLSGTPLIGGLFGDPAQDQLEEQMRANAAAWETRRPIVAQQYANLAGMEQKNYVPAQQALMQMYNGTQGPAPTPPPPPMQLPNVGSQVRGPTQYAPEAMQPVYGSRTPLKTQVPPLGGRPAGRGLPGYG